MKKSALALAALGLFVGLLAMPQASEASCDITVKFKNTYKDAIYIGSIAVDIVRVAGKNWRLITNFTSYQYVKGKTGELKKKKRHLAIHNCGKAKKRFRITYQLAKGGKVINATQTSAKRGRHFTITRTGRKTFKLTAK